MNGWEREGVLFFSNQYTTKELPCNPRTHYPSSLLSALSASSWWELLHHSFHKKEAVLHSPQPGSPESSSLRIPARQEEEARRESYQ